MRINLSPSSIPPAQVRTNASFGSAGIRIIAVIQDYQLDVAEHCLHGVIIGTGFGQTDKGNFSSRMMWARQARLARVGRVLIQGDPHLSVWIAATHLTHELTDIDRAFPRQEGPVCASRAGIIAQEEIESDAHLLMRG